jgi:hypothetical protein
MGVAPDDITHAECNMLDIQYMGWGQMRTAEDHTDYNWRSSCRKLDLSVAQPQLGAYIQTKLKSAFKLAQLCRAVKTNCRVCNNRSIHVMVKSQNLKSIFDNHVIVCALASITFFSDCESQQISTAGLYVASKNHFRTKAAYIWKNHNACSFSKSQNTNNTNFPYFDNQVLLLGLWEAFVLLLCPASFPKVLWY